MDLSIKGLVRGTIDTLRSLATAPTGAVLTQKLLPDYAQLVAEGRVWRAQEANAGTASVVALPTTAALFTIGNNEPDDGLWYVPLVAYAFAVSNAAAVEHFSLTGCLSQIPAVTGGIGVTLTQDIAKTTIKSMCGVRGGGYNGRAVLDAGVSITDDLWFPLGPSSGSTGVASEAGAVAWCPINGYFLIPPKTLFGMASVATATGCVTLKGLIYAEVPKSYLLPS
jgi:hypothetical protein